MTYTLRENRQSCQFAIGGLGFWATRFVNNEREDVCNSIPVLRPIPFNALYYMSIESNTKQEVLRVWRGLIHDKRQPKVKINKISDSFEQPRQAQLSGQVFQTSSGLNLILSSSFMMLTIDNKILRNCQKLIQDFQKICDVRLGGVLESG